MSVESSPASQNERPLFTVSNHHVPHRVASAEVSPPGAYLYEWFVFDNETSELESLGTRACRLSRTSPFRTPTRFT